MEKKKLKMKQKSIKMEIERNAEKEQLNQC